MRIVLDSSTLVSAFLSPTGSPAGLLARTGEGAFTIYVSTEILTETARALSRKRITDRYAHGPEDVERFVTVLAQTAELVSDLPEVRAVSRDPNDDVIIATAVAAKADYLVTGDNDLLVLGEYQGVRIVTPRQFLELL